MSDVTINKWRQLRRTASIIGFPESASITKLFKQQIVVVFGAKDTPDGRILSAKGKAK